MIHAMQGLLANPACTTGNITRAEVAKEAVGFADALLEANTIDEPLDALVGANMEAVHEN